MGANAYAWNNILWVGIVSGVGYIFGDLLTVAQYLGLIFGALTLSLLLLWSRDLFDRYWPGALAGLFLVCFSEYIIWAGAGTDSHFFGFLFTMACWLFTREVKRRQFMRSAPAWVLLMIARPEGVALVAIPVIIVLGMVCFVRLRNRTASLFWLLTVLGFAIFIIPFKSTLTGSWFPPGVQLVSGDIWTAFTQEWPAWERMLEMYQEFFWILLVMAAITLERGPAKLAPAFAALYVIMLGYLAMLATDAQAPGPLVHDYIPMLPVATFILCSGIAMLIYHRPQALLVRFFYFALIGGLTLGLLATIRSSETFMLMESQQTMYTSPQRFYDYAEVVRMDEEVESIAAYNASAHSYFLATPVIDLAGRHQPADFSAMINLQAFYCGKTLPGSFATTDAIYSIPEEINTIILPIEIGPLDELPLFLNHPQAAKLYYSSAFQEDFKLAGDRLIPYYKRRPEPIKNHLMSDYYNTRFSVMAGSVAHQELPYTIKVEVTNEGSGPYLNIPSPAGVGHITLRATWQNDKHSHIRQVANLPLPDVLEPDQTLSFDAAVPLPPLAGIYQLSIGLVHHGVTLFAAQGVKPITLNVEVLPAGGKPQRVRPTVRRESHQVTNLTNKIPPSAETTPSDNESLNVGEQSVGDESNQKSSTRQPAPLPTPLPESRSIAETSQLNTATSPGQNSQPTPGQAEDAPQLGVNPTPVPITP
jgi:hypothetical protein